ncbi:hypothetical protein SI859A1_01514 [Aurantimonas manganoxydans SI85-9A1]|uniref:Tyr recombinase domain-containing protein n=2 Tax=Aurantimonas manganoxydans TaxID=651183 RepID=Q1YIG5_AURMS|nr:hypothetical protein [Aurantimonas manganoxydans]EAS50152.1 hypothetical protein SI859A1_01514 [Aurantimonas manganoxydans SI85-9A1]BAT29379.1 hypothetical protein [Aurantimonas manganoxydans SI85-9A1]
MRAPSYVWKRGSSFFFQYAIPHDLIPILGRTPLRSRLPVNEPRLASRIARRVAVCVEDMMSREFFAEFGGAGVNRTEILEGVEKEIATLGKMLSEAEQRHSRKRGKTTDADRVAELTERSELLSSSFLALCDRTRRLATDYERDLDISQRTVRKLRHEQDEANAEALELTRDLSIAKSSAEDSFAALSETSKTADGYAERLLRDESLGRRLGVVLERNEKLISENEKINARLENRGPLFSTTFDAYDAHLTISSVSPKERKNLRRRCEIFVELVGDKPVASYDLQDLQSFAYRLTHLPERHSIDPQLRGMSVSQIIEMATQNSDVMRHKRFITEVTIMTGYVGRVKSALRYACAAAGVPFPYEKFGKVRIKAQSASVVRHGFWPEKINVILSASAERQKPEEAIVPLLALLTGARIGELVWLQKAGLVSTQRKYIFNLTNSHLATGRSFKSENARRFMVVHDRLVELGFADWVHSFRSGDDFLFPGFHRAKKPAGAASKRFQRLSRNGI